MVKFFMVVNFVFFAGVLGKHAFFSLLVFKIKLMHSRIVMISDELPDRLMWVRSQ